jgi:hypothetical protein
MSSRIDHQSLAKAEVACGLSASTEDAFHRAESGYMLQVLSERWLLEKKGLTSNELHLAWNRMDKVARGRVEQWVVQLTPDPAGDEEAFEAFQKVIGVKNDLRDSRPQVMTYLQGRAFRSVFEARF